MQRKLVNSQLSNYKTYQMYLRQLMTLAENVFKFRNLPNYLDVSYINKVLVKQGSIAFFEDEVLGLLALPYIPIGKLDVYGRPLKIQVTGQNGYKNKLTSDKFVLMYDNNGEYPIWLDVCQYAERIALSTRVCDINIAQQKTPRFWKTSTENLQTVRDLVNNVDGFENVIITYENLQVDDTTLVLAPAPYVADKIDLHKDKDWNEFLRLIGVANLSFQKKERNISNEISAMQGGTIASRFSRFEPRERAIEEINKKFAHLLNGKQISVEYYDGEPNSDEKEDKKNDELMDADVYANDSNE